MPIGTAKLVQRIMQHFATATKRPEVAALDVASAAEAFPQQSPLQQGTLSLSNPLF